jgi:hypothetical protein
MMAWNGSDCRAGSIRASALLNRILIRLIGPIGPMGPILLVLALDNRGEVGSAWQPHEVALKRDPNDDRLKFIVGSANSLSRRIRRRRRQGRFRPMSHQQGQDKFQPPIT